MLDDRERRQLVDDGVVVIRALLDDPWCRRLHEAIERCRQSPSEHYAVLSPEGSPVVESDLFRWFDDPDIEALTHDSPLTRAASLLLGHDRIVLVEDQWFSSAPAAETSSPWHQDHPYYNLDRPFLTVWITLDDVPADMSLRVVPGSHSTGALYAPVEFSATRSTIGDGSDLRPVPDVDARPDLYPVRSWAMRAGDAVAIDSRILHATGAGRLVDRPFRRVSVRWATPDTRYLDRGPHVARFWQMLPHGLRSGDLLAGDVFPLVSVPITAPGLSPSAPRREGSG